MNTKVGLVLGSLAMVIGVGSFQPSLAQYYDNTYTVTRSYYNDYPVRVEPAPEVREIERPVIIKERRSSPHHLVHLHVPLVHFDVF
jgi:hypothetical protein